MRSSILRGAVKRANANLAERELPPLPEKIAPHSLRRRFASVLYAPGEPPPVVMAEMGHTGPNLALSVYAQAIGRGEDQQARLAAVVAGKEAHRRTRGDVVPIDRARGRAA